MTWIVVFVVFVLGAAIAENVWRARAHRFIDAWVFDESVLKGLRATYPMLTPEQQALVLEGLRDFLHICRQARMKGVSMPSKVVDEAWHGFILSTRHYRAFCRRAFGRYLNHHPAETMKSTTQASKGLRRAWQFACRREGIDPAKPDRLPRLFALDGQLMIAGGFIYALDCMAAGQTGTYCASAIGCSSGCSSGCGADGGCSGDGGGCGGD